jgi:hypothetical protein
MSSGIQVPIPNRTGSSIVFRNPNDPLARGPVNIETGDEVQIIPFWDPPAASMEKDPLSYIPEIAGIQGYLCSNIKPGITTKQTFKFRRL